jgi:hypothetical protein
MSSGWMIRICLSRYGVQVSISSGLGSRFFGGLHFTMFVMKTLSLDDFICDNRVSRNLPAVPTKGSPLMSSELPGASPMNMIRLLGLPTPGTAFLRDSHRGHFVQTITSEATASNVSFLGMATTLRHRVLLNFVLINLASK